MSGLERLDTPPVYGLPHCYALGISTATTQPDTSGEHVEKAAQLPEPMSVVPPGRAADAANRLEGDLRRDVDVGHSGINNPAAEAHAPPLSSRPCHR